MSWKSIGEGEQSNVDFHYQPVQYAAPPVFPTYQVVMDSLKNILEPINDRFDPEKRMRRAQLAEWMSPQAQQLRQREMALREKNVGMQEQLIPSNIEATKAKAKMTTAQANIYDQASKGEHPAGWHFNGHTWVEDTPAQKGAAAVNNVIDTAKAAHGKTAPAATAPASGIPPLLQRPPEVTAPPKITTPPKIVTPPATGSVSVPPSMVMNNDEQMATTPQGIVSPTLNVAPNIMDDPYGQYS